MAGRHARFDPILESSPQRKEEMHSSAFGAAVKAHDGVKLVEEEAPQMRHPPKRRATMPTKLSKEDSISLQFAPYAEILRRISFMYTHHPVFEPISDSAEKADQDSTPSFSPMKPIDALITFARDFDIVPLMLINSEVRQAVVQAHRKRLEYLNVSVTDDRLLTDFIVVCSDMIAEKRPFRNVIGGYSPALRVQALLGFLALEQPGRWEGIVASRFESVNAMIVRHSLAEQEMIKREQQKRQTEDFARKGLGSMWEQVHQVFLYFCPRPPPPTAEETAIARAQAAAAEEKMVTLNAPEREHPRREPIIKGQSSARFGTLKKFQNAVQTLRDKLKVVQHITVATEEELKRAAARRGSLCSLASEGRLGGDNDSFLFGEACTERARPGLRASVIQFGGGGVDPRTGAVPGAVVASLLDEAWDGAALLASSGGMSTGMIAEDSDQAPLPITLPLPELLRWKYTNIDAPSEPPTPSLSPPPASPGLKGSVRTGGAAGAGRPRSG
eukprot:CAMPEP_0114169364 /NCGR_PEP_ID=MMETSP0043_2-20121206/33523_1 /TAXON_ID=464988 /ORGANISM="Hemiselmis andersenii, Strain CCMP644" /LENGTH=499 /DNA_ID=CAMNT_0001266809 /DNA_START=148 /DNA_END=1643 /DNA_ORIENTATION=+